MQQIDIATVNEHLQQFVGKSVWLHAETTNGAYAAEGLQGQKALAVGMYVRNAPVEVSNVRLAGTGPYRIGLQTPHGWMYAEGLTHWNGGPGELNLAGRDAQDRLAVTFQLRLTPFPLQTEERTVVLSPLPEAVEAEPGAGVEPEPEAEVEPEAGAEARRTRVRKTVGRERHVLVILPHPDDETLGCGGTIALHSRAGNPVTYACATRGEMGRNMGNPAIATRETLAALREQELLAACRILGVHAVRFLGIWDKTVEFQDRERLIAHVRSLIEEINPSLVITYHPEYSVHPDHLALGAATVAAVASLPAERRPKLHVRAFGSRVEELGPPDLIMDVRHVMDIKVAAAKAHRSQTEFMLKQWDTAMAGDAKAKQDAEERWAEEKYWIM